MASSSPAAATSTGNTRSSSMEPVKQGFDPASSSSDKPTTFVQADPSTFRSIVQRLTGAPSDPSIHKLPVTQPARFTGKLNSGDMGPRRSGFKLHERRQRARKLEIKLNNNKGVIYPCPWATARQMGFLGFGGGGGEMVMASPVSTLDVFARGSPSSTPTSPMEEEEEKAIATKGFYLHPGGTGTPRGGSKPKPKPELLTLFPLQSPRDSPSSSTTSS